MAPIIKQTISPKQLSFSKILILVAGALFSTNIVIKLGSKLNPMVGTVGGLVAFLGAILACVSIIYKHLAYFNYRLIDDELIMERVFSRGNHLFLSLKLSELEEFQPYADAMMEREKLLPAKTYKFTAGKQDNSWYVGEFTRSGDRYRFIINPNEELLNAITNYNAE